jgi:beta-galactosidase
VNARFLSLELLGNVSPEDDWSGYKVLVAPSWLLIDSSRAEKLRRFAENGRTLVLTCLSAMRDLDNINRTETIPSLLTSLCGIEVEEQQPLKFQDKVRFRDASGETHDGAYWFDLLSLHGAEPLATYDDRWFSGVPTATRHKKGEGSVIYVGTVPDVPYLRSLLSGICTEAGVFPNVTEPSSPLIESVKVFRSEERSTEYLHLINFTGEEQQATLPSPYRSLPDGLLFEDCVSLKPFGALFLERLP